MSEETLGNILFAMAVVAFIPFAWFVLKGKLTKARRIEPKE